MKSALEYLSYAAVIVAACTIVWRFGIAPTTPSAPPPAEDIELRLEANRVRHVLGDGPVAIVEFTDFECPYCQRHAAEVFPTLKTELIDTGKIRYVSMHFPLDIHPNAFQMAGEAECADDFWVARNDLLAGRLCRGGQQAGRLGPLAQQRRGLGGMRSRPAKPKPIRKEDTDVRKIMLRFMAASLLLTAAFLLPQPVAAQANCAYPFVFGEPCTTAEYRCNLVGGSIQPILFSCPEGQVLYACPTYTGDFLCVCNEPSACG